MTPDAASNPSSLIEVANTFGLGVAAMCGWIYFLLREIKDYKEKERNYAKELLDLSKENIATMHSLTQVVEAVAPAITVSSNDNRNNLESSVLRIKEHINNQCSILEKMLNKDIQ
jgi:uncharacterized protein (DUF2344 family)